ncbi:EamA family transporter RarD, partial [Melaminivora alkalimesophila]
MVKGLLASVAASVMFAAMYYMAPFLAPLDGEQIFGWRVLCTLPFTTVLLLALRQGGRVRMLALRVRRQPSLALALLASSAMLGLQLWLFLWAPLHGRALPVSLGYFLLPLVMVLAGRLLFRERLSRLQWTAAALAGAGVLHELVRAGGMSWETWVVALGYTVYFVMRRRLATDHLGGHWLDMLLLAPAALWFVARPPSSLPLLAQHSHLWSMVPVLGVVSAVALALYMAASR